MEPKYLIRKKLIIKTSWMVPNDLVNLCILFYSFYYKKINLRIF